jgi:hypothetical protein
VSNENRQNGLTDTERTMRARIGGYRLHALHDTMVVSAPGRKAAADSLEARLLAEIDPDGSLPPDQRAVRLARARKAHYTQLAYRSARARSRRAQKATGSTP